MNGHCHSYDINPHLSYSGWLVSVANKNDVHWHYTVNASIVFLEEIQLCLELWKTLDCIDPLYIHHHDSGNTKPVLNCVERQILFGAIEDFLGWQLPQKLRHCIHLFLLKHQNHPDFFIRWSHFFQTIQECHNLPPELISIHIQLIEWGLIRTDHM